MTDLATNLVYLDPPFNSNRDYNVIFRDESGKATEAQLLAFEDTCGDNGYRLISLRSQGTRRMSFR